MNSSSERRIPPAADNDGREFGEWAADATGRLVGSDKRILSLLGVRYPACFGHALALAADLPAGTHWSDLFSGSAMLDTLVKFRPPGKASRTILLRGRPGEGPEGEPLLRGIWVDITPETEREAELRALEARKSSLVNTCPMFIWSCDPKGNATYFNDAFYAYSAALPSVALGGTWAESLLHAEDAPTALGKWRTCLETGTVFEHEVRIRSAGRGYRWFLVRAECRRCPDGSIIEWVGVAVDIHARREIEDWLRNSEERFRQLADFVPVIVWTTDAAGAIQFYNSRWFEYTGQSFQQALGSGWADALHPDDRERVTTAWLECCRTGTRYDLEARIRRFDGTYRWMIGRGSPHRDTSGRILAWFGTCVDIEDRKQSEALVDRAREEAEAANRAKSTFLQNMSHDIRTPLTAMLGYAQAAQEETDPEKVKDYLERVGESGNRLKETLGSILELARLEGRPSHLQLAPVDLVACVQQVLRLLKMQASEKNLALTFTPASGPVWVLAESVSLNRVLMNICGNAVKFTSSGGVQVSLSCENEVARLSVQDTGCGISDAFKERLFLPFTQEDRNAVGRPEGSGLGLAIARQLLAEMGGTVSFDSRKGAGSTFVISLRRTAGPQVAPAQATQESGAQVQPLPSIDSPAKPARTARPRLLVVEDDPSIKRVAEIFLGASFDVTFAMTLENALEAAAATCFEAVLLDINIHKDYSGVHVMHMLRKLPGYEKTRMVAFTAYNLPGDRERFLSEGFDAHLPKPFAKKDLLKVLDANTGSAAT